MMTCKELTELITDYLEGRLSIWDRMMFQMHVGMCRHCREYLRQMKTTVRTVGALPAEAPPPEVTDALLARFKDWKKAH